MQLKIRIAAVALACAALGCVPIAAAGNDPGPKTRYHDIEANKAANMHALGLHMARTCRAR